MPIWQVHLLHAMNSYVGTNHVFISSFVYSIRGMVSPLVEWNTNKNHIVSGQSINTERAKQTFIYTLISAMFNLDHMAMKFGPLGIYLHVGSWYM